MTTTAVKAPTSILSKIGNPSAKIAKSDATGQYLTGIVYLAPYKLSGHNVCPTATPACIAGCLNTAGLGGVFGSIQRSRIARTKYYVNRETRGAFIAQLKREIMRLIRKCDKVGVAPCVRLNGTSDIAWERTTDIIHSFPAVQFYDYTKDSNRMMAYIRGEMPENYHLTFSRSEENQAQCEQILALGGSVAVVFSKAIWIAVTTAGEWRGFPVFNGDVTDLRFLDPTEHIIALYAKGKARNDQSGFVVRQF